LAAADIVIDCRAPDDGARRSINLCQVSLVGSRVAKKKDQQIVICLVSAKPGNLDISPSRVYICRVD
jgi:hypothetical protein